MHIRIVSLVGGGLFLFVIANLILDSLPVDGDVCSILLHFLVCFLLVVHLQETFTVGDYRVDMGLVLNGDFESAIPLVHLNVHLDCAVV
jgi:hypothetical protein